jgi:phosphoglycerate dehydrogenase-like enzyme
LAWLSKRLEIEPRQSELQPSAAELLAHSVLGESTALLTMVAASSDPRLPETTPRLQVVSQLAAGVDNLDLAECSKRGAARAYAGGAYRKHGGSCVALLMTTAGRIADVHRFVREGNLGLGDPGFRWDKKSAARPWSWSGSGQPGRRWRGAD